MHCALFPLNKKLIILQDTEGIVLSGKVKGKGIPGTGHGGPQGCETSRLPRFLDNRLTDTDEVFSLMRWPAFTPRKIPGTHFCSGLSRYQDYSAAGRIRSIKKSNDLIGNRTRDVPACSVVPEPTTLPRATLLVRNLWVNAFLDQSMKIQKGGPYSLRCRCERVGSRSYCQTTYKQLKWWR
jgi:hypothetical protein